jgi:hypothetical protein
MASARHDANLRIDGKTDRLLSSLSKETGKPKKEIVARAIERVRRDSILDSMNAGYAALKSDPGAWRKELDERGVWSVTNADGLSDAE